MTFLLTGSGESDASDPWLSASPHPTASHWNALQAWSNYLSRRRRVHGRSWGCLFHEREPDAPRSDRKLRLTEQAAGIAACLGAEPPVILQAAEIGMECV